MTDDIGSIFATYTDPDGTEWLLSNTADTLGWFTTFGIAGWGATGYEIVTDPIARGGEAVRFVRNQPARITWPLHIWGDTHQEFVDRYRSIKRAFLKTVHLKRPGVLRVARPDSTAREIEVYYEDGFTGNAGENHRSANPALTLFAPDGYWRGTTATVETRFFTEAVDFLDPFMTVSSNQILGDTTISNEGDVVAWPVWTITGPAAQVVATNETTGDSFTLTYDLAAGDTLTITTQQPSVRDDDDVNRISALNWPTAILWALLPGDNDINFTVSGASAGTTIDLEFFPRYDGA